MHTRYSARTGVLLTNLGSPAAPTAAALRPYLAQFLSDPRVIELPQWKWQPILRGIILRVRPAKSAKLYASVWTEDGAPLLKYTRAQAQALSERLAQLDPAPVVKYAMRYGQPSIASVLREFQDAGINRLIVLPLYPQYSAATTASTFDALSAELVTWRWLPELHFLNSYHDHPSYIAALAATAREHVAAHGEPERWILSYHGMPKRYFDAGDPYHCYCRKTSRLLAEAMGWEENRYMTTFQSLFGREEWLRPYTNETLSALPKAGVRKVAVLCPGFSADCLETIEEIDVENRHVFLEAGGDDYHYVPALNQRPDHIEMMADLIEPYLVDRSPFIVGSAPREVNAGAAN